jgi:hypothetical protein
MGVSTLIFFLGLALYFLKKRNIGLLVSVIGFSAAAQFNFYLIYLAIFYPLCFALFKNKSFDIKTVLISLGLLAAFFSPFIVAELKWNFLMTHSLLKFGVDQSVLFTVTDSFSKYIQSFAGPIYNSLFFFNPFVGFLIAVFFIFYLRFIIKDRDVLLFFYLCLFSTLPLFGFRSGVLVGEIVNGPILPFYTILFALGINELINTRKYKLLGAALLIAILLSNGILFIRYRFIPLSMFNQQELTLKDEENAIDYTYKSAQGKPFSVCVVTAPMFINTLWGYLYNWYGLGKYGYLPLWSGQKQYLISSSLPYDAKHVENRYFIIEGLGRIPSEFRMTMLYLEDKTSRLEEVRKFGNITVQKRILQAEPRTLLDTQKLTPADIAHLEMIIKTEPRFTCYNSY